MTPPATEWWPAPTPEGTISTTVSVPGSKSLTNRALILAALADGPSVVRGALRARDTELMAAALTALGSTVDRSGTDWTVTPRSWSTEARIDCGLAGTVMRFVPPVAALSSAPTHFDGDEHMRQRPVGPMLGALSDLGVAVDDGDTGALPFTIGGTGSVPGGRVLIDASASSQFVSALLLAGARYDKGIEIVHEGGPVPSRPHIDMTVAMLREHGVDVDDQQPCRWRVDAGPIRAIDRSIEPDLSNSAPFLALGAVTGGTVVVRDWPLETHQPGDELRTLLTMMGCDVRRTDDGVAVTGPDRLQGITYDLHEIGELTPTVAALCALAETPSHLTGVGHIRGHETDRLSALATELNRLGGNVEELADGLQITPAPLHGGRFHTYADHRMAHAAVILGLGVEGVEVENIATTSKTFPDFADAWEQLT